MKNIKNLLTYTFLLLLIGCTSEFEEVNIDPNNPTDIPADYLLTEAQISLGNGMYNLDLAGCIIIQQLVAQGIYAPYNIYAEIDPRDNSFSTARDQVPGLYDGVLMELQEIIIINSAKETLTPADNNLIAVARLLKAYTFQLMTDSWGDIPYSEALQGVSSLSVPYDTQESIYQNILLEIDESLAQLEADTEVAGDIIYNGDAEKWIKFGNALKLRVAMRLSEVNSSQASTVALQAINAVIMDSNEDNASIEYLASSENNFLARFIGLNQGNGAVASSRYLDIMKQLNDPRLPIYFSPAIASDEFDGLTPGLRQYVIGLDEVSLIQQKFTNQDATYELINADEVMFNKAELIARGWLSGDAKEAYEEAITLSMQKLGVPEADILNYLAQPEVGWNDDNAIELIGTQKWLSGFMQGANAWAEWRRLEYPVLTPAPDAVNNINTIPGRIPYPVNERFLNESAYNQAVSNQGADAYDTKIWWDK